MMECREPVTNPYMLERAENIAQPGKVAGPVQRIVGIVIPPREYPCLCCSHWHRAYRNAYCDACHDHNRCRLEL